MVNLKNAHDKNGPITLSYHNFQLQVLHVYCSISAQVRLVLTNHIQEFCYSFDYICKLPQALMIEEKKITLNP